MNRLASTVLALGLVAGPAGIALAAAPAPSAGATAPPAHSEPIKPIAHHQRTDVGGDRMTQALNLLEARGYGDFSDFRQSGNDFTATVKQSGQQFTVLVNPDTGQISRQG